MIFDMDGTLLDTEKLLSECLIEAASDEGWTLEWDTVVNCIGTTFDETERIVMKAMGSDFPYGKVRNKGIEKFKKYVKKRGLPFKNGAHRLLDCLDAEGLPFGIATTTERKEVYEILSFVGILNRFSTIVCGDEVKNSKPHPEIYEKAAGNLGISADEALVFEDSSHGISSASNAGARVVWVPDLQNVPDDVRSKCYDEIGSLDAVCDKLGELVG